MGLRLNVDLDTNRGQTNEAYVRIETIRFNRVLCRIEYTISCWVNKQAADAFDKKYIDDPLGSSQGILTKEVVYYDDDDDVDGREVVIDNYYTCEIYREEKIETPVYEEQEVVKLVPYVTFDENGEEKIVDKEIKKIEQVQVGVDTVIKKVVDFSLVEDMFDFTHKVLKDELSKIFPEDRIEIV